MRSRVGDKPWPSADRLRIWRPLPAQLCITIRSAFNWRAEQALRPVIVTRKVCGGNRSWHGAESQHILASVIPTTSQRQLNPHVVLASRLHAASDCRVKFCRQGSTSPFIRDYLGHASVATTSRYITTNLKMKRDVLDAFWKRVGLEQGARHRWHPSPKLLTFLETL
jgi:integrase